jgi:L-amino acid N-acyltransferase YncA
MEPLIRHARPQDLPALVEIFNQGIKTRTSTGFLTEVTVADRQAWFDAHSPQRYPLLVAEVDGKVVGYLSLEQYRPGRDAFRQTAEGSLFIHEDYRRKGIGSQLTGAGIVAARSAGFSVVLAIILDKNKGSIRLLDGCGFSLWGRLPAVGTIDGVSFDHLYYGFVITPE